VSEACFVKELAVSCSRRVLMHPVHESWTIAIDDPVAWPSVMPATVIAHALECTICVANFYTMSQKNVSCWSAITLSAKS